MRAISLLRGRLRRGRVGLFPESHLVATTPTPLPAGGERNPHIEYCDPTRRSGLVPVPLTTCSQRTVSDSTTPRIRRLADDRQHAAVGDVAAPRIGQRAPSRDKHMSTVVRRALGTASPARGLCAPGSPLRSWSTSINVGTRALVNLERLHVSPTARWPTGAS